MSIENREKVRIAAIFSGTCIKKNICPVKDIMATYGDKWTMLTVLLLGQHEKLRFNEMRAQIKGISQRMLTVTLRSLEENGLVSRSIYHTVPPRVDYRLTPLGESLVLQLLSFASWADENVQSIIEAREIYNKSSPAINI